MVEHLHSYSAASWCVPTTHTVTFVAGHESSKLVCILVLFQVDGIAILYTVNPQLKVTRSTLNTKSQDMDISSKSEKVVMQTIEHRVSPEGLGCS